MLIVLAFFSCALTKLCEAGAGPEEPEPEPDDQAPRLVTPIIRKDQGAFGSESFLDACHLKKDYALFVEENLLRSAPQLCYFCICYKKDAAYCFERMPERCYNMLLYMPHVLISSGGSMPSRGRYKRLLGGYRRPSYYNRPNNHVMVHEEQRPPKMLVMRQAPTPLASCSPLTSKPYSIGCLPEDWCKGCVTCTCKSHRRYDCIRISFCNGDEQNTPMPFLNRNDFNIRSIQSNYVTNLTTTDSPEI